MPVKHKICFVLAAIHLFMVAIFASHFAEWGNTKNAAAKAAFAVGDFTGSNNIFSFFAPGLSDQPYVIFTLVDTAGKETVIDFKGDSPDFTNRINNVYGYLALPEARQIFSASLAKFVLNNYPSAVKIRVEMVVQKIPTMAAFNKGKRCRWAFWFYRDFQRNATSIAKN